MAQMQADRPLTGPEQVNPLGKLTYAIGSLVSIGLVVGMGVWGYKLLVRDVSGVPVVRAAEGPMRVQPDDPGGEQALNQGLSVNGVAAVGSAEDVADRLILAPAPLDLTSEDAPAKSELAQAAPMPADNDVAPDADGESIITASVADMTDMDEITDTGTAADTGTDTGTDAADTADAAAPGAVPIPPQITADATTLALAEALAGGIEPQEPIEDQEESDTAMLSDSVVDGGIGRSLRPKQRPETLSNIREVAAPTSPGGTRDVDASTIAPGTRLAQLGAFKSEEIARAEWTRLEGRFEDYLAGKDRVIQRAESGGRTFYRLRALGFEDLAEARRFCSALVTEQAECIPVEHR